LPDPHRMKARVQAFISKSTDNASSLKSKSTDNASSSEQWPSESDDGGIDQSGFGRYDVPVLKLGGQSGFDSLYRPEHGRGKSGSFEDTPSSRVGLKSRGADTGRSSRDHGRSSRDHGRSSRDHKLVLVSSPFVTILVHVINIHCACVALP